MNASIIPMQAFGRNQTFVESRPMGRSLQSRNYFPSAVNRRRKVIGLQQNPMRSSAPVGLEGLRLPRRRLETMGAVEGIRPFPVADSSETFPWVGRGFSASCEEVTIKGSNSHHRAGTQTAQSAGHRAQRKAINAIRYYVRPCTLLMQVLAAGPPARQSPPPFLPTRWP
jgi:hypothetical protein